MVKIPGQGQFLCALQRAGGAVLDAALPPQCLVTGARVGAPGDISPAAWNALRFIDAPMCKICGVPFAYDQGDGAICGACAAERPVYERARAALAYDDASRRLVLDLKHGDKTDGAPAFGRWMARAGRDLLADADLIAPTPLHWRRLFKRKFNQAALLAEAVGKHAAASVAPDLLRRRRATRTQGGLKPDARRRNVAGAFDLNPAWAERVKGARIVVIDDVQTTGATLNACALVLKRAGAAQVDALVFARVVRAEAGSI
ncbi:MAG: ComF family protein [Pseudomonadota bacterium]